MPDPGQNIYSWKYEALTCIGYKPFLAGVRFLEWLKRKRKCASPTLLGKSQRCSEYPVDYKRGIKFSCLSRRRWFYSRLQTVNDFWNRLETERAVKGNSLACCAKRWIAGGIGNIRGSERLATELQDTVDSAKNIDQPRYTGGQLCSTVCLDQNVQTADSKRSHLSERTKQPREINRLMYRADEVQPEGIQDRRMPAGRQSLLLSEVGCNPSPSLLKRRS